ncbi:MAG: hypothetical protein MJZ05_12080 [Fibrobacter sp.]|nr:hypothetical protein [Fibrobacter sp.]
MDENLKENNAAASAAENNAQPANKPSSDRVKRMRGWLGINNSSHSGGFSRDGEAPVYGDAPNGWNR